MNYKQKQRIEQLTESTLIIGADIAKSKHVARAQDFRGIELGKRLIFDNTRAGLTKLMHWIRTLMVDHGKTHALVGIEPTGHYWLPMAEFLRREGVPVVVVNPLHVKRSKELDDNSPTKNDIKDARVIGQLVKDGRYSEPNLPSGVYAELRVGMVQRDRLNQDLNRVKGRIHNWLDRYFPEYTSVFKDWEGKASLMILNTCPLPREVIKTGTEAIVALWKTEIKRAVGIKRANKLMQAARESIGLSTGIEFASYEIRMLLEQYDTLCKQMETLMEAVQELLQQIPGSTEMMTIPGVGLVTVAGFLAEVGDLKGYEHGQQIIKLAGLNLKENSSGKHKGQSRISKRGRPRLRALLFKTVLVMVAKNREFKAIHQYLITRDENPLKKKQSIVALCGKLIRILFTIGSKQISYDAEQVLGVVRQVQLQEAG
ncbi:IS110 family transposase [Desulfotomaculum sp. 1211_IL3151]|uniref:IS110 family transposase n=1 Tax=Desulfotomaculum sp. 1211_IL3151 TaxID=3084055 RepID=UPI002FDAFF49